jgi:hypothetical protein
VGEQVKRVNESGTGLSEYAAAHRKSKEAADESTEATDKSSTAMEKTGQAAASAAAPIGELATGAERAADALDSALGDDAAAKANTMEEALQRVLKTVVAIGEAALVTKGQLEQMNNAGDDGSQ